jgi:hypothetical protein
MPETLRLNLGCGSKKYPGYVNVDVSPYFKPDMVVDLEKTPWPWQDSSADEIKMEHVLEHLGETTASYLAIWKEIWRVGKAGCVLDITVPHWNHESQHHDPTHMRAVTPIGVAMFSQERNMQSQKEGKNESALGLMLGIDISLKGEDVQFYYTQKIIDAQKDGSLSHEDLKHMEEHQNNVCEYITMKAYVVKPPRSQK